MIAIYYNPHKKCYYAKYVRIAYLSEHYKVGYVNQYDHEIVCMFYIDGGGKLINCQSWLDYVNWYKYNSTIKKRTLSKLINLLDRLKCSLERSVRNERKRS